MLTRLLIRNFKRFEEVDIPLASPVVFVGPNNSGKTTALQALALWELGLRRWKEKRSRSGAKVRSGVAIGRRELLTVPVPATNLLWRRQRVRNKAENIRIDVLVEGNTGGAGWQCGLEFDFANDESIYCRPLRKGATRMSVPDEAYAVEAAYLPPMSGLTSNETRLDDGAINVRIGEGRTAEVLRNLCHRLASSPEDDGQWRNVRDRIASLFRVRLDDPEYIAERGEIAMTYRDADGTRLDLVCAGRGLQQTLLLLSYLALHPGAVLLLDEPDAHLELLRQREIYQALTEAASRNGGQLIVASHSEEVLNQAAGTGPDSVVAFLGKPHRIPSNRTSALRRALDTFGFDQYYLAEQTGWVLYLEERTDLRILQAFAEKLQHPARDALRAPFLFPVGNQPNRGREHFNALADAKPGLTAFLLVDSDAPELQTRPALIERRWIRREIENYLCQPETLIAFAGSHAEAMKAAIRDHVAPAVLRDPDDPWWKTVKASDEFLDRVLPAFYRSLGTRPEMPKAEYYRLVDYIPAGQIDPEVVAVLDTVHEVASNARPGER